MAPLTTVVSRIDMTAPRTTTDATSMSPRSSLPAAAAGVAGEVAAISDISMARGGTGRSGGAASGSTYQNGVHTSTSPNMSFNEPPTRGGAQAPGRRREEPPADPRRGGRG